MLTQDAKQASNQPISAIAYIVFFTYLFLNSFNLPHGLLYTTIISPLLYLWLITKKKRIVIIRFLLITAPFVGMHFLNGVDTQAYGLAYLLCLAIYITCFAFREGAVQLGDRLSGFLTTFIVLNFIFVTISLGLLMTPYSDLVWRNADSVTANMTEISRLRMLTYEPSYYSTLIAPLALFAFFNFTKNMSLKSAGLLAMTVIPLLFSFSFGVLSSIIIALGLVYLFMSSHVMRKQALFLFIPIGAALAYYIFTTDNLFILRVNNFLAGTDSSGTARTSISYWLASEIAETKDLLFGVGFGQIKILGTSIIDEFWQGGRLPCAAAETIAQFGYIGLALRLLAEIFFFFKTRVYANPIRCSFFITMFVYQFTGSYLTNLAEYIVWALAFSRAFPEHDIQQRKSDEHMAPVLAPQPVPQL